MSASLRFALAISAVFALAALVAGGIAFDLQSRDLSQRLAEDVRRTAESLARTSDPQDLGEEIAALTASVQDGALIVAWTGPAGDLGNVTGMTPFAGARRLTPGRDFRFKAPVEGPEGYFAYGLPASGGWLMVGRDDAWLSENREVMAQTSAWGLGAALVLSVGLAAAVARRTSGRIAGIRRVLAEVGGGNHAARIGETGRDDLAEVARAVDATLDRLEAGIAAIRQVSTDVAHDLRAPLSRLRLRLEPMGAPEALAELDAISATFDAILRLARLQSGTAPLVTETLELGALLSEVAELFDPAPEVAAEHLTFRADRELLIQALVNLVDNAQRHGGGHVVIRGGRGGPGLCIAVEDRGPGIAEDDRARATERFVRLDASRSTPGTGLGLALVAAIAANHRGSLRLEDNAPGLRAVLDLPPG